MTTEVEDGPWDGEGDTIEIDNVEWPGFATVDGLRRANKWDDKKSKGEHIGERDFTGADAAKGNIKIKVWTRTQRAHIDETLLPTIEPEPGKKKVGPVSVKHSVFTSRKVSAITIDDIVGWDRTSFDEAVLTINYQEYRAPIATNATGKASGTAAPDGQHNTSCMTLGAEYQVYLAKWQQGVIDQGKAGSDTDAQNKAVADTENARAAATTIGLQMMALGCGNAPPSIGAALP